MTAPAPQSQPGTDRVTWSDDVASYFAERVPDGDGDVVVIMPAEMRDRFVGMMNSHATLQARVNELEAKLLMASGTMALEGLNIDTHATMVALSKQWCAKAIAAEKQVEELTKALENLRRDIGQRLPDRLNAKQHLIEQIERALAPSLDKSGGAT